MNWYFPSKFPFKFFKARNVMTSKNVVYTDLKDDILKLKKEFEERYSKNELSKTSEQLINFKFMAILGQGAFGVVVSNSPLINLKMTKITL